MMQTQKASSSLSWSSSTVISTSTWLLRWLIASVHAQSRDTFPDGLLFSCWNCAKLWYPWSHLEQKFVLWLDPGSSKSHAKRVCKWAKWGVTTESLEYKKAHGIGLEKSELGIVLEPFCFVGFTCHQSKS